MKWEKRGKDWHGFSDRFGRVMIQYSRKTKTAYLITTDWKGSPELVIGSFGSVDMAKKKASE